MTAAEYSVEKRYTRKDKADFFILNEIQKYRFPFLDSLMIFFTKLGDGGFIWIILCILFYLNNYVHIAFLLVSSLILESIICNLILKPFFAKPRPFKRNTFISLLIPEPHDFSFPSGHTSASFACVTVLLISHCFLWKYALILSAVISFSRLYLYVHYPSDVLAGLFTGIVSAVLVCFFL